MVRSVSLTHYSDSQTSARSSQWELSTIRSVRVQRGSVSQNPRLFGSHGIHKSSASTPFKRTSSDRSSTAACWFSTCLGHPWRWQPASDTGPSSHSSQWSRSRRGPHTPAGIPPPTCPSSSSASWCGWSRWGRGRRSSEGRTFCKLKSQ